MPSTRTSNNQLVKAALENARTSRTTGAPKTPDRSEQDTTSETNGTGQSDTPLRISTHAVQAPVTLAKMKPVLEAELSGGVRDITVCKDTIYPSFKGTRISRFITHCALYDKGSKVWKDVQVAEQKTGEKHLYTPLKEIIHSIFLQFHAPDGEKRWVKDTHNVRMSHIEGGYVYDEKLPDGTQKEVPLKSSPDLSILGHGLHFSGNRSRPRQPGYRHCLCPVEIKTEKSFNTKQVLIQAGVYARQCFIHQPYRRYVPVVVIAGSKLYLHIYDRSGVLRSSAINIHDDPATFVRIILGVSSVGTDMRYSPFDPRVRWKLNDEHPTITVENKALEHDVKYKVTGTKFSRKAIRGRGTYCANAQAEINGKVVAVLIKDAWRSCDRAAEWALLKKIQGLDGVGQILAYDENENTINTFRQHILPTFSDKDKHPSERIFSRLVLQAYGRSIRYFSSKLQLLEALYDAATGHKNLWKAGILHRDVSVDNILLGLEGAGTGNRGILIDFDMAIDVHRTRVDSQYRTGTRAFQSVAVLSAAEWGIYASPQDHLDDLESYLYVLGWICIKYDDTENSRSSDYLDKWEHPDPDLASSSKLKFLVRPSTHITEYFNTPVFRKLLSSLATICHQRYLEKAATSQTLQGDERFPPLSQVHDGTKDGKDHENFLTAIKIAIDEQKLVQEEERRKVPDNSQFPLTDTNVEFVDPADVSDADPQASAASSNLTGTKRSNPASHDEDEGGSGSLSKRPKISGTRRSARLSAKK